MPEAVILTNICGFLEAPRLEEHWVRGREAERLVMTQLKSSQEKVRQHHNKCSNNFLSNQIEVSSKIFIFTMLDMEVYKHW